MQKAVISLGVAGALSVATATGALAGWGCGFSGTDIPGNFGYVFGFDSEAAASEAALTFCQKDHQGCYIVACKSNVDTDAQAKALWPMKGPSGGCLDNNC